MATASAGPACAACGEPAVVHWQRRLTTDEIAAQQAIEQARHDQIILLAAPQLPKPVFPPMPDLLDATRIVLACGQHAIGIEAAALIHTAECAAPPKCTCTPQPLPVLPPDPELSRPPR